MHKLSDLFKRSHRDSDALGEHGHESETTPFPSERDIFTLRKQRGVNLGTWPASDMYHAKD